MSFSPEQNGTTHGGSWGGWGGGGVGVGGGGGGGVHGDPS